jgi:hypothetical protein
MTWWNVTFKRREHDTNDVRIPSAKTSVIEFVAEQAESLKALEEANGVIIKIERVA